MHRLRAIASATSRPTIRRRRRRRNRRSRPWAEILRQWSTSPEFAYLPRKFKVAISGVTEDRARSRCMTSACRWPGVCREIGFKVYAGGASAALRCSARWCAVPALAASADLYRALVRVFNRHGRRDNAKARIKILVKALGREEFARQSKRWAHLQDGLHLTQVERSLPVRRCVYETLAEDDLATIHLREDKARALGRTQCSHKWPAMPPSRCR